MELTDQQREEFTNYIGNVILSLERLSEVTGISMQNARNKVVEDLMEKEGKLCQKSAPFAEGS